MEISTYAIFLYCSSTVKVVLMVLLQPLMVLLQSLMVPVAVYKIFSFGLRLPFSTDLLTGRISNLLQSCAFWDLWFFG